MSIDDLFNYSEAEAEQHEVFLSKQRFMFSLDINSLCDSGELFDVSLDPIEIQVTIETIVTYYARHLDKIVAVGKLLLSFEPWDCAWALRLLKMVNPKYITLLAETDNVLWTEISRRVVKYIIP